MYIFMWDLRAADCLSANEHLHLNGYAMEFFLRWNQEPMAFTQETVTSSNVTTIRLG